MKRALLVSALAMSCHARSSDTIARPSVAHEGARTLAIEPPAARVTEGSAIALARLDGRRVAFVADEDEEAIHTIDLDARRAIARTSVPGRPTQLLVTKLGLVVARREASSLAVFVADALAQPLRPIREIATEDEPIALALAPGRDDLVWVASGIGRRLEAFELPSGDARASFALGREPRGLAIASDGARAIVSYMSEGGVDLVELASGATRFVSIGREAVTLSLRGPCPGTVAKKKWSPCFRDTPIPKRVARQTFALARVRLRDEESFLAPYVLVGPGEAAAKTSGYGAFEGFSPSVFDVAVVAPNAAHARIAAPIHADERCALPRAAVTDPTSGRVFVACIGDDRVVEVRPETADAAKDDPTKTFGPPIGTSLRVDGGPSALAIDAERHELLVLRLYDRKLELLSLSSSPVGDFEPQILVPTTDPKAHLRLVDPIRKTNEIALPHVPGLGLDADAAAGRRLFHRAFDDRISSDGRACASCHPEGRDDGVVWPTPEGPRQTIFLAGRLDRGAPFGWSAGHASLAAHVTQTVKNLKGTGLDATAIAQLAAWLSVMPPPSRAPRPVTPEEARGRALFGSATTGCAGCHPTDASFTDREAHDVASATKADKRRAFLAPSLRFLAATAPYFHDGRYPTLGALLAGCDGRMGSTTGLGPEDRAALEAYLRSL